MCKKEYQRKVESSQESNILHSPFLPPVLDRKLLAIDNKEFPQNPRFLLEIRMPPESQLTTAQLPDATGRYGAFGGRYVPETLVYALDNLVEEYAAAQADKQFQAELDDLLHNYVGRPSPLYFARRLTEKCGGAEIWLKREDLNHTGAHKINNTLGQALLTLRMGKSE